MDKMIMRRLLSLIVLIPIALLLGSHLGAFHPLGDSLSVFRGPLAIISVVSVILLMRNGTKLVAVMAAVLVIWSAYTVLAPRLEFSAALDTPYSHYQKNMLFRMPSTIALHDDIMDHNPDFVSLQEVSTKNLPILSSLKAQYPTQLFCPFAIVGGVAVLSRWPLIAGRKRCVVGSGMAAMQVETPDGPVWVVSLHLHWPYPMEQAAQVRALLPHLKALDGPVVLGGDFNMVPWSHTMRSIANATNAHRIGVPHYTLPLESIYSLPIDHVLINNNNRPSYTSKRPLLGSDHFGVLARFYLN